VQATQPITGTEVIPPTGFVDPGRVSNLLDFGVWNQDDQQIGEVEDLVLNLGTAHVDYVIVNTAGYGDAAEKHVPVRWVAMTVVSAKAQAAGTSGPQSGFVLTVDQSQFDGAPEIDLATIPALGEQAEGWDADIQSYWQGIISTSGNETPAPATTATPESSMTGQSGLTGVVLATKLLEVNFQAQAGVAGAVSMKVDDVLVDSQSGEIKYVVLSASSTATGEKLIPLPLKVLGWDAANNAFTSNVDPQALLQAPGFEAGKYPPTITPDWDTNLRSYWEKYLSPGS
jgi:sporulation protein YlmC with PRC-barrel domain